MQLFAAVYLAQTKERARGGMMRGIRRAIKLCLFLCLCQGRVGRAHSSRKIAAALCAKLATCNSLVFIRAAQTRHSTPLPADGGTFKRSWDISALD